MNNVREVEKTVANKDANYRICIGLNKLKFDYPCRKAYNARREHYESDGTYFYTNQYMGEFSIPTYGLVTHFLNERFNIYYTLYCGVGEGKFEKWEKKLEDLISNLAETHMDTEKSNKITKRFIEDTEDYKQEIENELSRTNKLLNSLKKYQKDV